MPGEASSSCRLLSNLDLISTAGTASSVTPPPVTPDGRYIVVRGRLWRRANPMLAEADRQALVDRLMEARRAVRRALLSSEPRDLVDLRKNVDDAKVDLGERGPVWWTDGSPDLNRRKARNTTYADWFATVEKAE